MDGGVLARRFLDRGLVFERGEVDETSAVHVLGQHHFVEAVEMGAMQVERMFVRARISVGPRQNVSDQPGKVLIQLESLILAQSERWRQA